MNRFDHAINKQIIYSLLIKYEVTEEKNIDLCHSIFSCFVSPIMQLSVSDFYSRARVDNFMAAKKN